MPCRISGNTVQCCIGHPSPSHDRSNNRRRPLPELATLRSGRFAQATQRMGGWATLGGGCGSNQPNPVWMSLLRRPDGLELSARRLQRQAPYPALPPTGRTN